MEYLPVAFSIYAVDRPFYPHLGMVFLSKNKGFPCTFTRLSTLLRDRWHLVEEYLGRQSLVSHETCSYRTSTKPSSFILQLIACYVLFFPFRLT